MSDLEQLWENILSVNPERIRDQWRQLTNEEQQSVRKHLHRMVSEEGWLESQRASARAALQTIEDEITP